MHIRDTSILISGAASGLGAACARLLAQCGANLIMADKDRAKGQALAKQLGDNCHFFAIDVCDADSVQQGVDTALQRYGALHGAINCAGIAIPEKLLTDTGPHRLESFEQAMHVNLSGSFNLMRLAAAAMAQGQANAEGERGVIIHTASIAAYEAQIGQVAYAASKGGIVSMVLPAARELARHGIRVMGIAPGIFDTPILGALSDEARQSLGAQIPFPARLGKPEEFALLVQHIIENPFLNGEVIRLDGALRMAAK